MDMVGHDDKGVQDDIRTDLFRPLPFLEDTLTYGRGVHFIIDDFTEERRSVLRAYGYKIGAFGRGVPSLKSIGFNSIATLETDHDFLRETRVFGSAVHSNREHLNSITY